MDILCYEEIKFNFIKKLMCVIYVMYFFEILNVKDALLFAVLPVSIDFIFTDNNSFPMCRF